MLVISILHLGSSSELQTRTENRARERGEPAAEGTQHYCTSQDIECSLQLEQCTVPLLPFRQD